MTYTPPEGVTIGPFTADTLPASFSAPADAVVTYKIYGTSEGVGDETENLFDYTATDPNNGYLGGYLLNDDGNPYVVSGCYASEYIELGGNTDYTLVIRKSSGSYDLHFCLYDSNHNKSRVLSCNTYATFTTLSAEKYIRFSSPRSLASKTMLTKGSTAPASYIPFGYKIPISNTSGEQQSNYDLFLGDSKLYADEYVDYGEQKVYKYVDGVLTPTDPPATLPTIQAYQGENTLSSTDTLGGIELTGDWLAIMGSTEDESIDIGFTVDAEEYIAFVTVDDGPSIQVSDTITMPSSADSFSLEVVAWGRERYTDTVYNALS